MSLTIEVETDADVLAAARRVLMRASEGEPQVLTTAQARQLRAHLWDLLADLGRHRAHVERLKKRLEATAAREQQLIDQAVSEEQRANDAETREIVARSHLRTIVEAFTQKADGHRGNYARAIMSARVWLGETSS